MNKLSSELQSLELLLQKLVAAHEDLKNEVKHLRSENAALRSRMEHKEAEINNFQNKIKISKIVDGIAVDKDETAELKQKLNEYIKEIDRCIAQLSE